MRAFRSTKRVINMEVVVEVKGEGNGAYYQASVF